MGSVISVGAGSIATEFPDGSKGPTNDAGEPVKPRLTDDYKGAPPSNSVFTTIAYAQFNNFSTVMQADPFGLQTQAHGLNIGYSDTPRVNADGYSYDFHADLTLGLVGMNVSGTKLAAESDWTATADWDGQMRATMGEGLPFVYVTRSSSADVEIDFSQQTGPTRDVPNNPLSYSATGLNGSFNGGALAFNFPVDAGAHVADGIQFRISYDFDGDGKVDRIETYDWYGTDAAQGDQDYTGAKLLTASGPMKDMHNGSVKVELWRANGEDDVSVRTNDVSSYVKLPFSNLTDANGKAVAGGMLYLQGGAKAGSDPSGLTSAPAGTPVYDTTHVQPGQSVPGYEGPGRVWYAKDGVVGVTINGKNYGIFGPTGATWKFTDKGLTSNLDGKDYYSVAVLPDASVSTLMDFRAHAYAFVTDTKSSFTVDQTTGKLTTTFTATTQMMEHGPGLSENPMLALYRHQYINSDATLSNISYNSPRGEIKVLKDNNTFTTTMNVQPILPILPFVGTDAQKKQIIDMLHGELKAFLTAQNNPLQGDTYWASRKNAKYGDLAMLAQMVGYGQVKDVFVGAIEKQLERWFTADDGDKFEFVYDKEWATLIGYPASYGSEDKLNDHHFHYGYLINAAATIAQLDPQWAQQSKWGAMVNELIKDAANDDRNDLTYTFLRNFDPYAGHSWASGTGNGINQESASEALEFASAVARWGAVTGQKNLADLGTYLHTTEATAFQQYWQDVDKAVFPDGVKHSIMGIVGADGAAFKNFFDGDPAHIIGIQYTPINAGSLFMAGYPQELLEEIAELHASQPDGRPSEWMNGSQMALALADPEAALADYLANPQYEDGKGEEARAYTLQWIETLVQLGTPDLSITSNSNFAVAFNKKGVKSYTAFNPGTTETTITFSDGTKLTVGAGDMVTKTADGQLHTTDFQNHDMPQRPDGVPLDLPTDPPEFALTTIASNGDLTLSVEAKTGTAWITIGNAQPRALLHGDQRQALALDDHTKLVGIGRDPDGSIVLLGASNGGEPYYPYKLDATLHIGGGGAALYKSDWQKLEPLFGTDMNGDGIVVRGELQTVAQNGSLKLILDKGSGLAYVQDGDGRMSAIFRDANGKPTALVRNGWSLSAIGRDQDGRIQVLDSMPGAGTSYGWKLDAKGNWVGETVYNPYNITDAEALFQKDLNGDGKVPAPLIQLVAKNGDLRLLVDPATGNAMIQLENGTRLTITRGGPDEAVKLDHGSKLFAIGRDDQGRLRVLDGNANDMSAGSQHWAWILDANGHWVGEDVFSGTDLPKAETIFGSDLNGDGVIGTAGLHTVEKNGAATLLVDTHTGKASFSINGSAPQQITRDGADWGDVLQQRGDWGLAAIAIDDQGRTRVLDASPFSDMRYAWILDANGHWYGEESFDKNTVGAAEKLFSVDLNGDGVIGTAAKTATGGVSGGSTLSAGSMFH
ncbi:glycosyl hydrolase [Sphingomonas sp. TDK1]|uniref:glycosyl hydrolase n=1 Tax=Sphingomonas sp. TDK1 TaxID=453247 RepID=UPI0007D9A095|nr:glycosyl hydrolase [Sphingomonas sp. TDK1]OAN59891.1 hypothetical protein A7X12_01960 [Sphingomonas sp. TDK1]